MIFWKIKALAEALRANKISKPEMDLYLMVFIAQLLLPIALYALGAVVANRVSAVAVILLSAWGLYRGYYIVEAGDGREYFARFSTLAVPTLNCFYMIAGAFYLITWFAVPKLLGYFWFPVVFWMLLAFFVFMTTHSYLRFVAGGKPSFPAKEKS